MPKRLTAQSTLATVRKDAKRWLKAIRAGDADALRRLLALHPQAGPAPGLRDVQHALARDHGFDGWRQLREELEAHALDRLGQAERVDTVLHHVWEGDLAAATRIVARHPEIAHESIFTAILFGDLEAVRRYLAADPAAAATPGGVMQWEPILYLAYGRLPVPAFAGNSAAMAHLLIDHGADPNAAFDDGWGNPFKVLTGVIGLGEGVRPPHPQAVDMARLLIGRGADPFDTQALYNTSIVDDDTFWLDLLHGACEARGEAARWHDPGQGLGGRITCAVIDYLLGNAVAYNHVKRAEWLLRHGANPNGPHAYSTRPQYDEAMVHGHVEMADLLRRHGASVPPLTPQTAFQAACMRGDRVAARRIAADDPALLRHAEPMLIAARRGLGDVVALLLELGMDADVEDETGIRGLHMAASSGAVETARLLVAHGADIDRPSLHYGGAMGFASHFGRRAMLDDLAPLSRDVHILTYEGFTGRLAELFAAEPDLVNLPHARRGGTPLFCLPDDEDAAADMAAFLLAYGADVTMRNAQGDTPEQAARKRGLEDAADIIREAAES